MCTSYKQVSDNLCHALACVAKKISTIPVNPIGLRALLACRLIPLNKCPGVRPIGIGEASRRIISKAVMTVLKDDITKAAGCLQTCAGQKGGVRRQSTPCVKCSKKTTYIGCY